MAIETALEAKRGWLDIPWDHHLARFLKSAEMLEKEKFNPSKDYRHPMMQENQAQCR